jgi:SOS-response transcriptional repressor LexA
MTPLQRKALDFVKQYVAVAGHSPSYDEIGASLGRARSQVHAIVNALVGQNHIVKTGRGDRNIQIVGEGLSQISSAALLAELMRLELSKGAGT